MNIRSKQGFLSTMVAFCMLLPLIEAKASEVDLDTDVLSGYLIMAEAVAGVPIVIFTGVNLYYALEGERPSTTWRLGGWITGSICVAGGITWVTIYSQTSCDNRCLWLGIAHLGLGAMDIGFTIWASNQPSGELNSNKPKRLSLEPILMPDYAGNLAVGLGLRLLDW